MSMQIFEESGVFDPAYYNLKIGDFVSIIAVGGGGGGGCSVYYDSSKNTYSYGNPGGDAGKTSRNIDCSGGGGGGYGGGGGGGGSASNAGAGGGGGYLKTATIKLTSLDPIAVTVGKGGRGGYDNDHLDGEDGEASSFGSYVVSEGGGGGKAAGYNINPYGGIGGTNGGNGNGICGGGGGGGYVIGCNSRGDGGCGGSVYNSDIVRAQDGSITGGGGGGKNYSNSSGLSIVGISKGGSVAGGGTNQDGGPGSGVIVVTW